MKYKEISAKSISELHKELQELRQKAVQLAEKMQLGQQKNTHELRSVKKDIAKILTALHTI